MHFIKAVRGFSFLFYFLSQALFSGNLLLQYDLDKSNHLWHAARLNNLEEMKTLAKDPRTAFNIQQQYENSYIYTSFDWAVHHMNLDMVLWLLEKEAWTFKFTVTDFKDRFPQLQQKFNGRISYTYWYLAQKNRLSEMEETLEVRAQQNDVGVNTVREGETALDHAVTHKNEPMAKHLLLRGAKLCRTTAKEFEEAFPKLFQEMEALDNLPIDSAASHEL